MNGKLVASKLPKRGAGQVEGGEEVEGRQVSLSGRQRSGWGRVCGASNWACIHVLSGSSPVVRVAFLSCESLRGQIYSMTGNRVVGQGRKFSSSYYAVMSAPFR